MYFGYLEISIHLEIRKLLKNGKITNIDLLLKTIDFERLLPISSNR